MSYGRPLFQWPGGSARRCCWRNGFTLVELLVVIAIVALLMAILLPSLREVRAHAQRVKCAANLRQVAIAWLMYLDHEARGVFPLGGMGNLAWHYGGKSVGRVIEGQLDFNPRPLNPYVGLDPYGERAAEVFRCPADRGMRHYIDPTTVGQTTYERLGNSYPANRTLFNGQIDPETCLRFRPGVPLRVSDVKFSPAVFILVGDQQMDFAVQPSPLYSAIWHDHDGSGVNLGFLDGHAAFTRIKRLETVTHYYAFPYMYCGLEDGIETGP